MNEFISPSEQNLMRMQWIQRTSELHPHLPVSFFWVLIYFYKGRKDCEFDEESEDWVLIFSHIIYSSIFNVVKGGGRGVLCMPSLQCLSYKHVVTWSMHFPHAFISLASLHIILLLICGPSSQALELGAVRKLISWLPQLQS